MLVALSVWPPSTVGLGPLSGIYLKRDADAGISNASRRGAQRRWVGQIDAGRQVVERGEGAVSVVGSVEQIVDLHKAVAH